jgi:hypothetical protein
MIDLEQDVMTGVDSEGKDISNSKIFTKYSNMKTGKIPGEQERFTVSPMDNLRIVCTFHSCLDLSEKDFSVFSNALSADEKKTVYNLEWLGNYYIDF